MSDVDSVDENIEIGKLVDESINLLNSSKHSVDPKSFFKINSKLLSYDNESAHGTILTRDKRDKILIKSDISKGILYVILHRYFNSTLKKSIQLF